MSFAIFEAWPLHKPLLKNAISIIFDALAYRFGALLQALGERRFDGECHVAVGHELMILPRPFVVNRAGRYDACHDHALALRHAAL